MIRKITATLLAGVLLSFATDKPKEENLPQKQQERSIVWTVTETEANTIITGLNELPAKTANPLIQKLIFQAQKQLTDTIPKKK